jgi:hypothetical protein
MAISTESDECAALDTLIRRAKSCPSRQEPVR